MTSDEKAVLVNLVNAWHSFNRLPALHAWEKQEFMYLIHGAQHMVLARDGMRSLDEAWLNSILVSKDEDV